MSLSKLSECKSAILSSNGKTQKDLDEDIGILKEWIKQQAHFPQSLLEDTNFLEINLIRNKFSIEKTKYKLENYCTLKEKYSYLFDDYLETVLPFDDGTAFLYTMENLTDKLERILFYRIEDESKIDMDKHLCSCLMYRELTTRWDYSDIEVVILDYTRCSLQTITKMKINRVLPLTNITLSALSGRIKAIHIVNDKWITPFVNFLKLILPEKLKSRIYAHSSYDSLQESIPKKYLPKDFGGEQKSLSEIRDEWEKIFRENQEVIKASLTSKSDETLRIGSTGTELQGTFKKLNID